MTNINDFIDSISFISERFLPVTNFEGRFWISDDGRLISKRHRRFYLLSPYIDITGYYAATLRMAPKNLRIRVHSLVGTHFCTMVDKGVRMTWNHIDGNKLNNHYTNLEYITAKENCAHAKEIGLCDVKGERHGMSKLTDREVKEIYALKNSGLSSIKIGLKFNLSPRQTRDIMNGKAWQHITSHLS